MQATIPRLIPFRFSFGMILKSLLFAFPLLSASAGETSKPSIVACLGRIMPENGIVHLAAPYSVQGPSIVGQVLVTEGETVTNGQVVAITQYDEPLKAAYWLEEARVKVSEARLAQVRAGPKPADVAAQKAAVQRLAAELTNDEKNLERDSALHKNALLSEETIDRTRLALEQAKQQLEENRQKLESVSEVRAVDVAYAEADLEAARASARHAKAEWDQTHVRSPLDGTVLKIYAWPGALAGPSGIMELARTGTMFVLAEIYETDVPRIRTGQRAEITGPCLSGPLHGQVANIGFKVGKNEILSTDPAVYTDNRIVEVKIRLDDSAAAASFINAQVQVRITP